MISTLIFTSNN